MNLKFENNLWRSGYDHVVGLDEAGRGSWAGPLVAAAVVLPHGANIVGVDDSKKLTPQKRERVFLDIVKIALSWGLGIVSQKTIDEVGILQANKMAFIQALEKINPAPQYILVDGIKNFEPSTPHEFIISGDSRVMSIAAASIVAKVVRDQILNQLHHLYPHYNLQQHKGYGTAEHRQALQEHGLSEIHRLSFRPMEEIIMQEF